MPIYNLFSKRQRLLRAGQSDVLTYDSLPSQIRVQIIHILNDVFLDGSRQISEDKYFQFVRDILSREYGVFQLNQARYFKEEVTNFILHEKDVERVIDAVETCFRIADTALRKDSTFQSRRLTPDDAIEELNNRFKEHAIGYAYESKEIIRIDSTYMHAEVVKPVLQLLYKQKFQGANEEYLKAHEHYRHGRNKECLAECLKAFESTMKIICTVKGWSFNSNDTSSKLVNVILANNLIPSHLQSQITSFRTLLESGIPTIRNRIGGHGQGATLVTADDETTRYALNLTGSNLIYLIELSNI